GVAEPAERARELWARRGEADGLARAGPRERRRGRPPAAFGDRRARVRDAEPGRPTVAARAADEGAGRRGPDRRGIGPRSVGPVAPEAAPERDQQDEEPARAIPNRTGIDIRRRSVN